MQVLELPRSCSLSQDPLQGVQTVHCGTAPPVPWCSNSGLHKNELLVKNEYSFMCECERERERWSFALVSQAKEQWHDFGSLQSPPSGSRDSPASASQGAFLVYLHWSRPPHSLAMLPRLECSGPELLSSSSPPASASQGAVIIGVSHRAQPAILSFIASIPFHIPTNGCGRQAECEPQGCGRQAECEPQGCGRQAECEPGGQAECEPQGCGRQAECEPQGCGRQAECEPQGCGRQAECEPQGCGCQAECEPQGCGCQAECEPQGCGRQAECEPQGCGCQAECEPQGCGRFWPPAQRIYRSIDPEGENSFVMAFLSADPAATLTPGSTPVTGSRWLVMGPVGKTENPGRPDRELVQTQPHKWIYAEGSIVFTHSCANLEADFLGAPCSRDSFDLQAVELKGLTLSPRLVCSSLIMAHCSPHLRGSSDLPFSASQRQGLTLLPRLLHEILGLSNPPASTSQSAGVIGMSHHACPHNASVAMIHPLLLPPSNPLTALKQCFSFPLLIEVTLSRVGRERCWVVLSGHTASGLSAAPLNVEKNSVQLNEIKIENRLAGQSLESVVCDGYTSEYCCGLAPK
ncbi:hypothetical protein AAY473_033524 [Plecturocebus cupreus]